MQDDDIKKAIEVFGRYTIDVFGRYTIDVVNEVNKQAEQNANKKTEPQKEKPVVDQETKAETKPEETSGPTFKEVSTKFFALLDRIAEELSPEKAQANGVKLVNKYCGGEPISKDTLKPENFEALLADIDKCNKAMDERKNGK